MRRHVLTIHDVAPCTIGAVRELRDLSAEIVGGPVALLVVPRFHGVRAWPAESREWLHRRIGEGDEAVLHGCEHRTATLGDERELRGLASPDAAARLRAGASALTRLGVRVTGVIAPCYAYPRAPAAAVTGAGLDWWADRLHLHTADRRVWAPAIGLGASTAPRRVASPFAARSALRLATPAPILRVDLHPADLEPPRLRTAVTELLRALPRRGGRGATHRELLTA